MALKSPENRGSTDRRKRFRVEQYFDCTWLSEFGEERCRVSSLSTTGCFIECRFTVPHVGTSVSGITVTLPTGEITLQGTVVSATKGVGFAIRFTDIDATALARLTALVQTRVK